MPNGIVRANWQMWADQVHNGNYKMAAGIFSDIFSFLPTFSDKLITEREEAKRYYEKFFQEDPTVVIFKEEPLFSGSDCCYVHSGLHMFRTRTKGNVLAGFSFFWVLENGEWKQKHFHSSVRLPGH